MALPPPQLLLAQLDGHMDWDDGWGLMMVLGMLLVWLLIIGSIVWLVREFGPRGRTQSGAEDDDPLRTLDRRLAEGSISPDDYRERRAILADRGPT